MALSFRQIEVLHVLVTARSITAAAQILKVSQPSLSRTLRRLEDVLDVTLFQRTSRGLVPTVEALAIQRELDSIVGQISLLDERVARIAKGESTTFRLGATASVARALVPQALRSLTVKTPSLDLFFDVLAVDQMEDYLVTGRGECVVTITRPTHPLLACEQVGSGELVAVLPADHPIATRDPIEVDDLVGCDLISFQQGGPHQRIVAAFLAGAPVPPRTRCVVRFAETAIALADQGMGIALIDSFTTMGPLGTRLAVKRLANAPTFDVFVQWNTGRPRSRHVEGLMALLRRQLRHTVKA